MRYKLFAQLLQRRLVVDDQLTESRKGRVAGAVDHLVSRIEKAEHGFAVVDAGEKDQEPDVVLNLKKVLRTVNKVSTAN